MSKEDNMSKDDVIDIVADLRMQLLYLEENAGNFTEEDLQGLKNILHRTASICTLIYRRKFSGYEE
jgi:hypothetical protein